MNLLANFYQVKYKPLGTFITLQHKSLDNPFNELFCKGVNEALSSDRGRDIILLCDCFA